MEAFHLAKVVYAVMKRALDNFFSWIEWGSRKRQIFDVIRVCSVLEEVCVYGTENDVAGAVRIVLIGAQRSKKASISGKTGACAADTLFSTRRNDDYIAWNKLETRQNAKWGMSGGSKSWRNAVVWEGVTTCSSNVRSGKWKPKWSIHLRFFPMVIVFVCPCTPWAGTREIRRLMKYSKIQLRRLSQSLGNVRAPHSANSGTNERKENRINKPSAYSRLFRYLRCVLAVTRTYTPASPT